MQDSVVPRSYVAPRSQAFSSRGWLCQARSFECKLDSREECVADDQCNIACRRPYKHLGISCFLSRTTVHFLHYKTDPPSQNPAQGGGVDQTSDT